MKKVHPEAEAMGIGEPLKLQDHEVQMTEESLKWFKG